MSDHAASTSQPPEARDSAAPGSSPVAKSTPVARRYGLVGRGKWFFEWRPSAADDYEPQVVRWRSGTRRGEDQRRLEGVLAPLREMPVGADFDSALPLTVRFEGVPVAVADRSAFRRLAGCGAWPRPEPDGVTGALARIADDSLELSYRDDE